jgi:hypothetical protein
MVTQLQPTANASLHTLTSEAPLPKFVGHVRWNLLLQEFFHSQLGFGAFGSDGEGHETLFRDYQLFRGIGGRSSLIPRSSSLKLREVKLTWAGVEKDLPMDQDANMAWVWRKRS